MSLFFRICFILYFFKLSAGRGFCMKIMLDYKDFTCKILVLKKTTAFDTNSLLIR